MSNSDLVMMTPATAKPVSEQAVYDALREVAKAARAEPGCLDYRVFQSATDSTASITFERWSSKAERDAFLAGPDVKAFGAAVSRAFVTSPRPAAYQDLD